MLEMLEPLMPCLRLALYICIGFIPSYYVLLMWLMNTTYATDDEFVELADSLKNLEREVLDEMERLDAQWQELRKKYHRVEGGLAEADNTLEVLESEAPILRKQITDVGDELISLTKGLTEFARQTAVLAEYKPILQRWLNDNKGNQEIARNGRDVLKALDQLQTWHGQHREIEWPWIMETGWDELMAMMRDLGHSLRCLPESASQGGSTVREV